MFGVVVIGGLTAHRVEIDLEAGGVGRRRGQAPADAVIARRLRHPEPDIGRAREAAAEHRQAVAELRVKPVRRSRIVVRRQRVSVRQRPQPLRTPNALSGNEDAAPSNRLDTEFGYGLPVFGGGFTGTPNVGFGLSETTRDYRIGWRLTPAAANASGFEVNLDAVRREAANDNDAEHGVMLRSLFRW